ncbi:hypothetical protein [Silvibacterium sp.]|uniref:hypothetical protein n=1 Tax=Silvibacterium sp. TaxID=1964179 RepID=UPI0039E349A8
MRETLSIWFFAGLLFGAYGLVITAEGIWELSHPLAHPPTLYSLHAPIWWGGFMLVAGLIYLIKFWPKKLG